MQAGTPTVSEQTRAVVVYDGGCPFCSAFARLTRLREAVGPVTLVDARSGHPIVRRIAEAGLDLDDGMVLEFDGRFYHGADCLNRLALMSTRSGLFNRINALLFSNPAAARIAYPVLRAGRNAALALLGRPRIDIAKELGRT